MNRQHYTLTADAKAKALRIGKRVLKSHSHAEAARLFRYLRGVEWYGPLALGSKTHLYLVDDTVSNQQAVNSHGWKYLA